ncbi:MULTISPECIES: universal stress protein [Rhodopseudomonas]|uniref:Universal stress protein UspA n=1 Tax=Rhodopseudomonas palustris TaxID=1076 RepID=A0A0D7EU12_RHOPL|nr:MULTISPECIES: universal stress protein [Rhodopseudomonas]KIZ44278.1 universal stress protein UspA [Rhodopseudomonas palustris]MDF3812201.1 universal stress protein [Rhodopseudomonas sp. BAL398]WOK18092.1 universal stress protein [Rhodopseudomonas sp. BAL398]
MPFKNVLVALTSYAEPTSVASINDATAAAAAMGTHVAALCFEIHIALPGNLVSASLVGDIIADESHKSRDTAQCLLDAFEAAAKRLAVLHERILEKSLIPDASRVLVDYARVHDLTVLPAATPRWIAETIIFAAGRPTLVLPAAPPARAFELGTVAVAWNSSRASARAVADAMPVLKQARQVRVVTVVKADARDSKHSAEELAKSLARHGIDVVLDRVDANGRTVSEVLTDYTQSHDADLLVMGAYGHSRWREFVVGGTTKTLLSKPPLPVLFSH